MPAVANRATSKPSPNTIADGTDRLLRAAKRKMLRDYGRIDYEKLEREGFSAEMIERLKAL